MVATLSNSALFLGILLCLALLCVGVLLIYLGRRPVKARRGESSRHDLVLPGPTVQAAADDVVDLRLGNHQGIDVASVPPVAEVRPGVALATYFDVANPSPVVRDAVARLASGGWAIFEQPRQPNERRYWLAPGVSPARTAGELTIVADSAKRWVVTIEFFAAAAPADNVARSYTESDLIAAMHHALLANGYRPTVLDTRSLQSSYLQYTSASGGIAQIGLGASTRGAGGARHHTTRIQ